MAPLVALYAALLPVGDLSWGQDHFNRLGANASLPIALILACPALCMAARNRPGLLSRFGKGASIFLIYLAVLSAFIAILAAFRILGSAADDQGDLLLKALRFEITLAFAALTVLVGGWAFIVHRRALLLGLYIALALQGILTFFEYTHTGFFFSESTFHFGADIQQRPRLLQPESSLGGAVVMATGGAIVLLETSAPLAVLASGAAIAASLLSGSRGATSTLLIAAALTLASLAAFRYLASERRLRITARVVAATFLAGSLVSGPLLLSSIVPQDAYTSNATRAVYASASVRALESYPLGAGMGQVFQAERAWLADALDDLRPYLGSDAASEVITLVRQTGTEGLLPKTLPATMIFTGGLIGLASCFWLFQQILTQVASTRGQRQGSFYLRLFWTLALVVMLSTYISGIYEYAATLMIGILLAWRATCASPS